MRLYLLSALLHGLEAGLVQHLSSRSLLHDRPLVGAVTYVDQLPRPAAPGPLGGMRRATAAVRARGRLLLTELPERIEGEVKEVLPPAFEEGPQQQPGSQKRVRALADALLGLPRTADAMDVHQILGGQHLVTHNTTTLLHHVKKRNKWRLALLIMQWADRDECSLPLTTTHYNMLLSACAKRAPRQVLKRLRFMLARGRQPNVVTFNTAMQAALNLEDPEASLELFDEMVRSAPGSRPHRRSFLPLVSLLHLLCPRTRALALSRAHALCPSAQRSRGLEPTTISFNTAINACARARDAERALGYFRAMEAASIERNTVTYTGLIHACAEGMQLDKAMALFTYMEVVGVERNAITYSVAINGCTRNGQWELGLQLLQEMQRKGIQADTKTYNAAISACEKGLQWRRALHILEVMHENGCKPTAVTYGAAISACAKGKQTGAALELLERMREEKVRGARANSHTQPALYPTPWDNGPDNSWVGT
jgi:pentatricopeptide repeat protein